MLLRRNPSLWISVIIGLSLTGTMVTARSKYPPAGDPYINDYARILNKHDVAQLRMWLADLKRQKNIQVMVVTINSIKDYDTGDKTVKSFAVNLFRAWGIGHEPVHKGVLVLWAAKEGQLRIQLGADHAGPSHAATEPGIDRIRAPGPDKKEDKSGTSLEPGENKRPRSTKEHVTAGDQHVHLSSHAESAAVPSTSASFKRGLDRCALLRDYMERLAYACYHASNPKEAGRLTSLKSKYQPLIRKALPQELAVELASYEKLCQCVHKMKLSGVSVSKIYARGTCGSTTTKEKRLEIIGKCRSAPLPAPPE